MRRVVRIVGAALHDSTGGSDGAYPLLRVEGSPSDVGVMIAVYLADCNLINATPGPLTLTLDIEIARSDDDVTAWAAQDEEG